MHGGNFSQGWKQDRRSNPMLIAQQIFGLFLAGFSGVFMLWFLANLIRESRRHPRHANLPVEKSASGQASFVSPQVSSRPARVVQTPARPAPQAMPTFGQSARYPHIASR
jgi:hypothetical protein